MEGHLRITMAITSMVCMVSFCMALGTLAVDSMVFEQFLANICTSSEDDTVLTDKSFYDCLKQCGARTDCTAVSYMQKTALCRMDVQGMTPGECQGYIYVAKTDWKQANSNRCNCPKRTMCREDGTCLIVECDKLHDPDNGQILGMMFGTGDKVYYSCNCGYVLNETRNRVCQANGSWNGQDVTCVEAGRGIMLLSECYTCVTHLYNGTWNTTVSGRICQRWDTNYPHFHDYGQGTYPPGETLSKANNYCRDPSKDGYLWCYTIDKHLRWERCEIRSCT